MEQGDVLNSVFETLEDLRDRLQKSQVDFRAEVIAAELITKGVKHDQLLIASKSTHLRNHKKDILNLSTLNSEVDLNKYIVIDISRDGLYDYLPESLFHIPINVKTFKSVEEAINEIRIHREEEKTTRKFFLPLENEFFKLRIFIEFEEISALRGYLDSTNHNILRDFWRIPRFFDKDLVKYLVGNLPYLSQVRGNITLITEFLTEMFGVGFSIEQQWERVTPIPEKFTFQLGEGLMNGKFVLGHQFISDTPLALVRVGPVEDFAVHHFLPQGKRIRQIRYILDLLLPAFADNSIKVITQKSEENEGLFFKTGQDSFLGYNSYI